MQARFLLDRSDIFYVKDSYICSFWNKVSHWYCCESSQLFADIFRWLKSDVIHFTGRIAVWSEMSQNPVASTSVKAAPTSADACMSIVHSLMHYRQGVDDRGESEQVKDSRPKIIFKGLKFWNSKWIFMNLVVRF